MKSSAAVPVTASCTLRAHVSRGARQRLELECEPPGSGGVEHGGAGDVHLKGAHEQGAPHEARVRVEDVVARKEQQVARRVPHAEEQQHERRAVQQRAQRRHGVGERQTLGDLVGEEGRREHPRHRAAAAGRRSGGGRRWSGGGRGCLGRLEGRAPKRLRCACVTAGT